MAPFAFIPAAILIVKQNVWGLAIVDSLGLVFCFALLFVHRIKFEIRASITLLGFYSIGLAVILSVGPLSGGPIWLFVFAVLAGVLMGNWAAFIAILMNAVSLIIIGLLISTGKIGTDFPFFNTQQAMITAVANFIVLNAITSISVSALLKGLNTSVQRYSLLAKNATDVIWTTDMGLNFTYISPSVSQLQEYTAEEGMTQQLGDKLTPDSFKKIMGLHGKKMEQLEAGLAEAWEPIVFEAEQYRKDGTTIWTSIHARILKGPDNKPEGILGINRDISDGKRAEKERDKLLKELQDALDSLKTLSGLLPICSKCKKIRDDKGYWNHLESYIEKHSDVSFSHSICKECSDELYGKEDWYIKKRKNEKE